MLKTGTVIQSNGSNCIVASDNQKYDCVIKGKLRQKGYNSTNPVAVGDIVEFDISIEPATIASIHERRNCIIRKSTNLSKQSHIIAANIDQAVFVFTMHHPETTTVFLDRFLVSAESYSIPTIIIFNKIDIYKPEEFDQVAELMATYAEIGYKVLDVSVTKNHNIDAVREILKDKVSLISGQSGVGKTSIVNAV
ncbi:MAG: ribosome small subunit-dependent GTPase A, partial [Bacteroidales bacterium]|nr:ribosome small subunit-dependent GTPase A [Bacteroidales bacterium]